MKKVDLVKDFKGKGINITVEIDEDQEFRDYPYCTTYIEEQKFKNCRIRDLDDKIEVMFNRLTYVDSMDQETVGLYVHEAGAMEELAEILKKMESLKDYKEQYVLDDDEKGVLEEETVEFGYDPYEMRVKLISTPVVAYIKKYFKSHDHLDFNLDRYDLTDKVGRNEELRTYTLKNGKASGFYIVADIPADFFEKVVVEELERYLEEIENDKIKKESARKYREKQIKELAKKAKETGEKQVLSYYYTECTDDNEDCDLDRISILVDENGDLSKCVTHMY